MLVVVQRPSPVEALGCPKPPSLRLLRCVLRVSDKTGSVLSVLYIVSEITFLLNASLRSEFLFKLTTSVICTF